eukprot:comp22283_c0_seq1/m.32992 comp22283_c0_seq1/g.32992  ORF comp22283_c0_seq1/g.32992 comp22283_c0_seq1/m.32992 type:complete len:146 (-) comp22283_c0_seq1:454-891(-)
MGTVIRQGDPGGGLGQVGPVLVVYLLLLQLLACALVILPTGRKLAQRVLSADQGLVKGGVLVTLLGVAVAGYVMQQTYTEQMAAFEERATYTGRKVTEYSTYFRSQRDLYMVCWLAANSFIIVGVVYLQCLLVDAQQKEDSKKQQ